jgi:hypothetical protein
MPPGDSDLTADDLNRIEDRATIIAERIVEKALEKYQVQFPANCPTTKMLRRLQYLVGALAVIAIGERGPEFAKWISTLLSG